MALALAESAVLAVAVAVAAAAGAAAVVAAGEAAVAGAAATVAGAAATVAAAAAASLQLVEALLHAAESTQPCSSAAQGKRTTRSSQSCTPRRRCHILGGSTHHPCRRSLGKRHPDGCSRSSIRCCCSRPDRRAVLG
jgi:hypothetical protein